METSKPAWQCSASFSPAQQNTMLTVNLCPVSCSSSVCRKVCPPGFLQFTLNTAFAVDTQDNQRLLNTDIYYDMCEISIFSNMKMCLKYVPTYKSQNHSYFRSLLHCIIVYCLTDAWYDIGLSRYCTWDQILDLLMLIYCVVLVVSLILFFSVSRHLDTVNKSWLDI